MSISATFKNWYLQFAVLTAFQKKGDGMYIAAPVGWYGKSYLLNEDQLEVFENWYIEKVRNFKPSRTRVLITVPAILLILGLLIAVFQGYISALIALAFAIPLLIPMIWISFREDRKVTCLRMETFPFPDAPTVPHSFATFQKRALICIVALSPVKWLAWIWFAFHGIGGAIFFFGLGGVLILELIGVTNSFESEDLSRLGMILVLSVLALAILLAFPLAAIIPRRKFKKRTGQPLTMRNLYFNELRREFGSQRGLSNSVK